MEKKQAVVHPAGAAPTFGAMGLGLELIAPKTETNGQWSGVLYTAPPGFSGPPAHYHKVMDEAFLVLEGTLTLLLNGETVELGPGGFANVTPGNVHTFANRSAQPVKMLLLFSPGGFEQYFFEIGELVKTEKTWPPRDMTPILALMEKYDSFLPAQ